jgi:large subunit ribosomal protein L35
MKLKTNKSVAKRFKVTARGKIKMRHSHARHIMTKKSPQRKKELRRVTLVSKSEAKNIMKLIPYK